MKEIEVDENVVNFCAVDLNSESFYEGSVLENRPDISLYYRTPCPGVSKFARRRRSLEPPKDYISMDVSPNVLFKICFYLNKKDLLSFMSTCKRFYEIGSNSAFWEFINISNKHMCESALHTLLDRKIKVFRLSSATIYTEDFFAWYDWNQIVASPLTHLDLSQTKFTKQEVLVKFLCKCHNLQALSLELCDELSDEVGYEISKNLNLQVLNVIMAKVVTTNAMRLILTSCLKLRELSVGWADFTGELITTIYLNLPQSLRRLNFSGTRDLHEMNDEAVRHICERCPNLEDLDLSDNSCLTEACVDFISERLHSLEILSLSRCYSIDPTAFLKLGQLHGLNIYGCVTDEGAEFLRNRLRPIQINASPFSTVARPTVGDSVTSIWRRRTRDWY